MSAFINSPDILSIPGALLFLTFFNTHLISSSNISSLLTLSQILLFSVLTGLAGGSLCQMFLPSFSCLSPHYCCCCSESDIPLCTTCIDLVLFISFLIFLSSIVLVVSWLIQSFTSLLLLPTTLPATSLRTILTPSRHVSVPKLYQLFNTIQFSLPVVVYFHSYLPFHFFPKSSQMWYCHSSLKSPMIIHKIVFPYFIL